MKKFFCCILLSSIALFITRGNELSPDLPVDLLRERIYVQTDKHLYLAGEPILMKFLTTGQNQIPLVFSKVAYAELVTDDIAQIQIKVELAGGTGAGRMQLPADIPTGYYRLIAYTQYMRNEGADVFFEKPIAVLNTFQSGYNLTEMEKTTSDDRSSSDRIASPSAGEGTYAATLQTDKAKYPVRTNGELILNGLPENMFTLSVSIAGKEMIPVAASDLSLFRKNQTKQPAEFTGNFLPEYEGHIITGKIVDNQPERAEDNPTGKTNLSESDNPDVEQLSDERNSTNESLTHPESVPNENIPKLIRSAISFPTVEGIRFFEGQGSETGDVRFFTSGTGGTKEIATVVYQKGDKYRIDIQSPFVTRYVPKTMPELQIDSAYYGQLLARSVALQVFHYFSDDSSEKQSVSDPIVIIQPSLSYPLDEYSRFTTMREVFIEFIQGARFRRNAGKQELSVMVKRGNYFVYETPPLVLLDGVPITDHDAIYNYDPLLVERINIYYGPIIMGNFLFSGIVELMTYRRLHADLNLNKSTQIISYEGQQLPQRWDTPGYLKDENRQSRIPDSRHTLLWNPDVKTDGKTSIRLSFDTSDLTGEFQATVEGITNDGQIIFATSVFKVER